MRRVNYSITPDYARYAVYGELLPIKARARAKRLAGRQYEGAQLSVLRRHAQSAADYGRRNNVGEPYYDPAAFVGDDAPGFKTINHGRYSWRCRYDRYTYHALYAAIQSQDGRRLWYAAPDGERYQGAISPRGSILLRSGAKSIVSLTPWDSPRAGYHLKAAVRAVNKLIARGNEQYTCRIDDGVPCVWEISTGEAYHAKGIPLGRVLSSARAAFASRALQEKQTAARAALDRLLAQRGHAVWVSVSDSLSAGNCAHGTDAFVQQLRAHLGADGEIGAVTAAAILAMRDDAYTRRACHVAAARAATMRV